MNSGAKEFNKEDENYNRNHVQHSRTKDRFSNQNRNFEITQSEKNKEK